MNKCQEKVVCRNTNKRWPSCEATKRSVYRWKHSSTSVN